MEAREGVLMSTSLLTTGRRTRKRPIRSTSHSGTFTLCQPPGSTSISAARKRSLGIRSPGTTHLRHLRTSGERFCSRGELWRHSRLPWRSRTIRAYRASESPTRKSGTERRHVKSKAQASPAREALGQPVAQHLLHRVAGVSEFQSHVGADLAATDQKIRNEPCRPWPFEGKCPVDLALQARAVFQQPFDVASFSADRLDPSGTRFDRRGELQLQEMLDNGGEAA